MKGRVLLLGCAAMLALNLSAAFAQETYRCRANDAVSIMKDGTLDKLTGKAGLKMFDKVVFDIPNGNITFPGTLEHEKWAVEKTTLGNDYVLFPRTAFHLGHSVADGVTTFIRLQVVPNEQPRFMAFVLSYLIAGTCELLK